ncbi:MAG: trypsin-like peptidase domain-containing protein [Rhodocyclaceae bacterium]|nr:trypsin-like peptidase domain-containing protein [Rhodocyclaceae bacterium]MBX3669046.1 trypsin-like peptidase domain-containing protein [Rhodocyclaceae bacterium]
MGIHRQAATAVGALLLATHCAAAPVQPRVVTPRGELFADERATVQLFEQAKATVVFISTRERRRDLWTRNVFSVPKGTGSGFVWDTQGHVVTNFHVIEGASEANIRLADGRDYAASLVGASADHDLAVLRIKVPVNPPPPVPIGSSWDLKVGQKVYAIGNPFGLDWTLTSGVVSALDRSLPSDAGPNIEHLIQTDAAINPGNSGGPLLDSAGRLIGINTAIYSPSGAYAGVGFAVPVDTVNRVVPILIAHGKYVRPSLGIQIDESLNRLLIRRFRVQGVYVLRVAPDSGAAAAGLRGAVVNEDGDVVPGDIVLAVNGKAVNGVASLLARLDDYQGGDTVRLGLLRGGKQIELAVRLR